MARERFLAQTRLLVRVLPSVAEEADFALKGGTAINLFYRDMPRLSVDIDLTYLPIQGRTESLRSIHQALDRIKARLERLPRTRAHRPPARDEVRLIVQQDNAVIKIETSPVLRGTVHPAETRRTMRAVEDLLGFAEARVVAFEDLFAGKLVAALDRQHPRDLFDVSHLYAAEGISDELYRTFLVYVASSARPLHEILAPNLIDLAPAYRSEFAGMTVDSIELGDLEATRERLLRDVRARLDSEATAFLVSVHDGDPDFSVIGREHAASLPAIRWKLRNLDRLRALDPAKHARQRAALLGL